MIIKNSNELQAICAKGQSSQYITVDTEFIRKKGFFYPEPSLIQLSVDGKIGYICDVLDKSIDLEPLRNLFINPKVIKVFHSFKQDLHIIYKLFKITPSNVFDIQIASMFLGTYHNPSYNLLVNDFLGIKLNKELQFSNWIIRPLSTKQLEYAERDVTYLFKLFPILREKLGEEKYRWTREEMDNILSYDLEATVKDILERTAVKILHKQKEINPQFLSLLNIALRWREEQCLECNMIRNKIIDSVDLAQFIYKIHKDFHMVDQTRLATTKTKKSLLKTLESFYQEGIDLESSYNLVELTMKKRDILHTKSTIYEDLKEILKECSCNSSINKNLIGNNCDMLKIAAENALTPKFNSGWRYQVFGIEAEKLLKV